MMSRRLLLSAALFLLSAPLLRAQSRVDPSGHWEGTIKAPGVELGIEVDLVKDGKGELGGTIGMPAQNLKGLALAGFVVRDASLSFQVRGAIGERSFSGVLAADGQSMSGDFTQRGNTFPFALTRTGDARIEPAPRNPAITKELAGTWDGVASVNGQQRRLTLTMTNQPDGTSAGSLYSVDEGLDVPITTIAQNASSVTIEVRATGVTYTGTVNPQGTELAGTLKQGAFELPLAFERAAK